MSDSSLHMVIQYVYVNGTRTFIVQFVIYMDHDCTLIVNNNVKRTLNRVDVKYQGEHHIMYIKIIRCGVYTYHTDVIARLYVYTDSINKSRVSPFRM